MASDVIPEEYKGREQTLLKHRVLSEYLRSWVQKLGSRSRFGQIRLWYVDCFAGPWESRSEDRTDTSVDIGIRALEEALDVWGQGHGQPIEARAVFVERNATSCQSLRAYLEARKARVPCEVLEGEFGANVDRIVDLLGADPAFLFVDPTGWKGVAMDYIAKLAGRPYRDVMVNVMFDYIKRWLNAPLPFLKQQMKDFFGLADNEIPPDLDEAELLSFYRERLKIRCGIRWAADLAIPYPDRERTFFRLVVGGHHEQVLDLFREVERRVVGQEAAPVRAAAKQDRREQRTGQLSLDLPATEGALDKRCRQLRDADLPRALHQVQVILREHGPAAFGQLWPRLLEGYHLTRRFLAETILGEAKHSRLRVSGWTPRDRTLKDEHVISLPEASPPAG
jgi:three-Cys-motif partner protein